MSGVRLKALGYRRRALAKNPANKDSARELATGKLTGG